MSNEWECVTCGSKRGYACPSCRFGPDPPSALAAIAEQLKTLEHRLLKEEQVLLGEISAIKRRHREPQAGSPRSYELEDIRRELRKAAALLRAANGELQRADQSLDTNRR